MGYYIKQREAVFKIKAENKEAALKAIKALATTGREYSWVSNDVIFNASTLKEAMSEWRWDIEVAKRPPEKADIKNDAVFEFQPADKDIEDVVGIYFAGEKSGDDAVLFEAIAPFVEKDSYIEMEGEEGEIWRWTFDGKNCDEKYGRVVFD